MQGKAPGVEGTWGQDSSMPLVGLHDWLQLIKVLEHICVHQELRICAPVACVAGST